MARLAKSLETLRKEIDELAPKRSKRSDGWIGDSAHQARASRHNPNDQGVVTALDVTDDPKGGCPIHEIANRVRQNPHAELAYIISNRRIAGRSTGWRWHRYTGSNPHAVHAHFAVGEGPDSDPRAPYDSTRSWNIKAPSVGERCAKKVLRKGDVDECVPFLRERLAKHGFEVDPAHAESRKFGDGLERNVKAFQRRRGIKVDGIVGRQTWEHLRKTAK